MAVILLLFHTIAWEPRCTIEDANGAQRAAPCPHSEVCVLKLCVVIAFSSKSSGHQSSPPWSWPIVVAGSGFLRSTKCHIFVLGGLCAHSAPVQWCFVCTVYAVPLFPSFLVSLKFKGKTLSKANRIPPNKMSRFTTKVRLHEPRSLGHSYSKGS